MANNWTAKKLDTWPNLSLTLKQINQESLVEEGIDLKEAAKVTMILKKGATKIEKEMRGPLVGTTSEEIKKATGANVGKVTYFWREKDLEETGVWEMEFEIEWEGATKRFQSVPNEGVYHLEVVALGGGAAEGTKLIMKKGDTFPPLKAQLKQNGSNIDLEKGGPAAEGATAVKVWIRKSNGTAIVSGGTCTGWKAATVKNKEGKVEYAWETADLKSAEEGITVEFLIEWKGGTELGHTGTAVPQKQTVPSAGHFQLETITDLVGD
jgi:hypothetical protein